MRSLAFQITNDLLFARLIVEDINPTEVQILVQARLAKDKRFREEVVHFAYGKDRIYAGEPICNQAGHNLKVTKDPMQVNCQRCLQMYDVQSARAGGGTGA